MTRLPRKGGVLVRLEGIIGEGTEIIEQLRGLSGTVVLDLDKVLRITSFGILQWTRAMEQLGSTPAFFIKCRAAIITQFNLVQNFGGRGELVSFYAPYICRACDREFDLLLDLRHHYEIVLSGEPPFARCRSCGEAAELNANPDDFFSYMASRPRPQLSRTVQQIIDGDVGDVPDRLRVRKEVTAEQTRLFLSGPISRTLDLRHWLDGLEGLLVLDLFEVTFADEVGMNELAQALSSSDVDRIHYDRVRSNLLPVIRLVSPKLEKACGIYALAIEAECKACDDISELEVGKKEIEVAAGRTIAAHCPRCGSLLAFQIAAEDLEAAKTMLVEAPQGARTSATRPSVPAVPSADESAPVPKDRQEFQGLVGHSATFRELEDKVRRVADSDVTVLLRGETGTGKELLARAIHQLSRRRQGPFVAVNCAALSESLIESELFGHEQGAFTGATERYLGRFERASGGTLFIDEVGDLPMRAQVKLLRALQEHAIERVGGQEVIPVDIRLVAATHQPLEKLIEKGEFRQDLFYRLSVVPFFVPPLRERPEDIWPLALHYLRLVQRRAGRSGINFSEGSRKLLETHSWPGNVRELVNVVERAVALAADGATITLDLKELRTTAIEPLPPIPSEAHLPQAAAPPGGSGPRPAASLKSTLDEVERNMIIEALERAKGNRTRAAQDLGLSRQALGAKIQKYGL